MRFLDRLTGGKLSDLPVAFLPGRYCLLEPLVVNGHSRLEPGDLLSDDGSGVIRIQDAERQVLSGDQADEYQADSDLSSEAINTIAGKLAHAHDANVSPMLPAEMAAQCALEELERNLAMVLSDGHLHSISDRPRRDLRYDDLVAPVARARRLATSALNHLASHSDCWQQRTLSGVQPRKVLARFSEDDYAIYENRLYKRLLDRLDRHLARRVARIRGINSGLERALDFQGSEATHFRLRRDICKLWGEVYRDDQAGTQLDAGRHAFAELVSLLRAIKGLKQRGLYTALPARLAVPDQVHRTNIINHDPHYRHLPPLWDGLGAQRESRQMEPRERLAKHQQLQHAYRCYVGLVLRRALERYGLRSNNTGGVDFFWDGRKFSVREDGQDWLIMGSNDSMLRLVPIVWFGKSVEEGDRIGLGRVVCWPSCGDGFASDQRLQVSPLDLYVVEKMGRLVDEWMLRSLVAGYGRQIGPLPSQVKRLTDGWPETFESVSGTHVRLLAPLDAVKREGMMSLLSDLANKQLVGAMTSVIEELSCLSRLCGHGAQFMSRPGNEFHCFCQTCDATWELKKAGSGKLFSMRPKESKSASIRSSAEGFLWAGRDWLEFDANEPQGAASARVRRSAH